MSATLSAKARRKSFHIHSSNISPDSMKSRSPLPQIFLFTPSNLRLLYIRGSFYLKYPRADITPSAKRYERLMKANGIHQSQSGPITPSIRDTPIPSPRRKTSPSAGPASKKRKLDKYAEPTSNLNTADDAGLGDLKTESSMGVKAEVKAETMKEEPTSEEVTADSTASTGAFQHSASDTMGFDGANDGSLFDDFLAFGGSLPAMGNGEDQGNKETIFIAD